MTIAPDKFDQLSEKLPERNEADLRDLQRRGFMRYGIVAMLLDGNERMLLLEHAASDKADSGMWGALGETSHVFEEAGHWHVEPPAHTLLRGIREETGAIIDPGQLHLPVTGAYFETTWPIGTQHGNGLSHALAPIVFMSPDAVDSIMDAPLPEDEIVTKNMIRLESVRDYPLRPGMYKWLEEAQKALLRASTEIVPLENAPWVHPSTVQDARFSEMFKEV
jgi:hypothetical protein